jgi:hypothetical protein
VPRLLFPCSLHRRRTHIYHGFNRQRREGYHSTSGRSTDGCVRYSAAHNIMEIPTIFADATKNSETVPPVEDEFDQAEKQLTTGVRGCIRDVSVFDIYLGNVCDIHPDPSIFKNAFAQTLCGVFCSGEWWICPFSRSSRVSNLSFAI